MKEILSSEIIKKISKLDDERREVILKEQGIESFFKYHVLTNDHKDQLKVRNAILLSFAKNISERLDISGIRYAFLKGISFLEDLYPSLQDRFLSDIDLYIDEGDMDRAISILKEVEGFNSLSCGTWVGNNHKVEITYFNEFNLEVVLELHSQLFWHKELSPEIIKIEKDVYELPRIDSTLNLTYLIYHYAFQHNCQKLYWLFDIVLYYQKYENEIDWIKFNRLINEYSLRRSAQYTKKIIRKEFGIDMVQINGETFLPYFRNYSLTADQRSFTYLSLKFLLKDRILKDAFFYLRKWLKR